MHHVLKRRNRIAGNTLFSAVLSLFALCAFSAQAQAQAHSYFDMTESFSSDVSHFPKWTGMASRGAEQQKNPAAECGRVPYFPCSVKDWWRFVERERGKPVAELLGPVNDYGNMFPYTIDQINWAMEDYWETPYEFHAVSGDCEDYAITKYYSLRAMGVPAEKMRIIIVQDFNLGGVIHAILGVYSGSQLMLLDNQIKQVVAARKVYHYKPIYGINELGWWAYTPK